MTDKELTEQDDSLHEQVDSSMDSLSFGNPSYQPEFFPLQVSRKGEVVSDAKVYPANKDKR